MWRPALILCLLAAVCGAVPQLDCDGPTSEPVNISQFPWQVSLQAVWLRSDVVEHFCFGSIIGPTWVLTSAECFAAGSPRMPSVRAGTSCRDNGGIVYEVANVIQHEDYDNYTKEYNFALLEMKQPISFCSNVQAVVLGSSNITIGTEVTVAGWFGGSGSTQLRATNTTVVDSDGRKVPTIIYTGRGLSMYDTGTPLLAGNTQYGVAMHHTCECGATNIYAYVPAVRCWITNKTGV